MGTTPVGVPYHSISLCLPFHLAYLRFETTDKFLAELKGLDGQLKGCFATKAGQAMVEAWASMSKIIMRAQYNVFSCIENVRSEHLFAWIGDCCGLKLERSGHT